MATATQRIPGFVEVCHRRDPAEFETALSLISLPWVNQFTEDDLTAFPFTSFQWGDDGHKDLLMAVYGENKEWWVVAYVEPRGTLASLGFQRWRAPGK